MCEGAILSAVCRIPSEIWFRIALLAEEQAEGVPHKRTHIVPGPSSRSYIDLPSNLVPGSAPLTPLGPVNASDRTDSSSWGNDYFGSRSRDAAPALSQGTSPDFFLNPGSMSVDSAGQSQDDDASATDRHGLDLRYDDARRSENTLGPTSKKLLLVVSMACKALRASVWPLLIGRLRLSLSALTAAANDPSDDIWKRVAVWTGHVRCVKLSEFFREG